MLNINCLALLYGNREEIRYNDDVFFIEIYFAHKIYFWYLVFD